MMGLEEHLLRMFREDAEFHDDAGASHVAGVRERMRPEADAAWDEAAEKELSKVPFFVRGKARRNTEQYARDRGVTTITVDTLYDAKAHSGR